MPKARRGNELPRAMAALAVIYWGKPAPSYVEAVLTPIMDALLKCATFGRVEYVNRIMSQRKRRNIHDFEKMAAWLQLPATRSGLLRVGRPDLAEAWLKALKRFRNGTKFSTAFNSRGRSRSWKISGARLGAMYAKHLQQQDENLIFDDAVGAATDFGQHDEREIRRAMPSIPDALIDEGFFPRTEDNGGI
jgi:hypothetical protein